MNSEERHRKRFADGEVIFSEGDVGTCAYLIETGAVEILLQRRGRPVVLATRQVGEIVGEMAIVDDQPRSATARAVGTVNVLVLSQEQIRDRLTQVDPVLQLVLRTILDRFRDTLLGLKHEVTDFGVASKAHQAIPGSEVDWGRNNALKKLKLEQELWHAITNRELLLEYQPIFNVVTLDIVGFESLVRWRHPRRGLLSPAHFIPMAEESSLVSALGRHVILEACAAFKALTAVRGETTKLVMHINISPRHLIDRGFVDELMSAVELSRVEPQCLVLEVTEGLLIERPDEALAAMQKCVEQGFQMSLDDFGTGYSGLSYLSKFPISQIKIDRSFVSGLNLAPRSAEVLRSICDLAKTLSLDVVSEGIEEELELQAVRDLGCLFGQGYYYSRPVPLEKAKALLLKQADQPARLSGHREDRDRASATPMGCPA